MTTRVSALGHAAYDPRTGEVRTDIIPIQPGTVVQAAEGDLPAHVLDALGEYLDPPGMSANPYLPVVTVSPAAPAPSSLVAAPTPEQLEVLRDGKKADLRALLADLLGVEI